MAPHNAVRMELIEQSKLSSGSSDEVLKRLNQLLNEGELSQRDIAKFTGYSTSVISQALAGNYEGDVEKIEDALGRCYRNWLAKNAVVETGVVREIHATMMLAWKRKEMARITGPFGRGKSKALSRFVALNPDFAVYLELTSTTSAVSILHRIAEALNIESQMSGSADDKLMTIIRALQRKPRLIVIDEADNLKPKTLAILKDVHGGESAERPWVEMNYGVRETYPQYHTQIQKGIDLIKHANLLKLLQSIGLTLSKKYVVQKFGIPAYNPNDLDDEALSPSQLIDFQPLSASDLVVADSKKKLLLKK